MTNDSATMKDAVHDQLEQARTSDLLSEELAQHDLDSLVGGGPAQNGFSRPD